MGSNIERHPELAEILDLLNGEASGPASRTLHRHLDGCWHCRKERNELEASIDAFVRYRESVWMPSLPPPPRSWPDIGVLCAELDQSRVPEPARRWVVWRAVAAGFFAIAVTAAMVAFFPYGRVSPPAGKEAAATPAASGRTPQGISTAEKRTPAKEPLPSSSPLLVEVQVVRALHGAGADLGESIEVGTEEGVVVVKAIGLEPDRAAAIRELVLAIPGTHFALVQLPSVGAESAPVTTVLPRPILFRNRLRSHFGSDTGRDEFANAVIDLGDAITARAYAWSKLEERFGGLALPAEARQSIRAIQDTHRTRLRERAMALRNLLATVFPEQPPPGPAGRSLMRATREFDELVSAGFAGARSSLTDAELLGRLQSVIQELTH